MMVKKKSIHILSIDRIPKRFLTSELNALFGEEVEVTSSLIGDEINKDINPAVVLTTGDFLSKKAKDMFPNSYILNARRDISYKNLDKVIQIPNDEKVLVVNHPKEASLTTIKSLEDLGFDHLKYVPYYNRATIDMTNIKIAISPSMMHLCPEEIKNKIDIGARTISFSTLSHLLKLLDLEESYLDKFLYHYNAGITKMSYKLSEEYQKSEAMRRNFNKMLDEIDDGIISIKENGEIVYMNNACKKLLGLYGENVTGQYIKKILDRLKIEKAVIRKLVSNEKNIFKFNNEEIMLGFISLDGDSSEDKMIILKRVDEIQKLEEDVRRILYKKGYTAKYTIGDIKGKSKELTKTINIAKRIAKSESTVMITGESGTGKEIFAQVIHNESFRSKGSFVAVNLASLPETLVESELFGYSEGAFTGARKGGRAGLFEQAHKGTIFIDEIGDISPATQSRLLRVLEEKEVMRLGDNKILNIDIRVIAATNKDLKKLVDDGKFREDLYYRLNIFPIELPPLRERKGDIEILIDHFMQKNKSYKKISKDVIEILSNYHWPGNIRELTNVIEYMTQITDSQLIGVDALPPYLDFVKTRSGKVKEEKSLDIKLPFGIEKAQFILKTLGESQEKNIRIGRRKIAMLGSKQGLENFTEDKVRTMLKHLEKEELIFIGTTKQGSIITEKGKEYLGGIG